MEDGPGRFPRERVSPSSAITPAVPFCAAARAATAVVLALRSAPERGRPAAPTTRAAERGFACCLAGDGGLPRLLLLLRPALSG